MKLNKRYARPRVCRATFDQIRFELLIRGVKQVSARKLRNLVGRRRLGVRVAESISQKLSAHGLSHFPKKIPMSQNEVVILYLTNSRAAAIFED